MEGNILGSSESGTLPVHFTTQRWFDTDVFQMSFLFFILYPVVLSHPEIMIGVFLVQENSSYRPKKWTYLPGTGSKFRSCSLSGVLHAFGFQSRTCSEENALGRHWGARPGFNSPSAPSTSRDSLCFAAVAKISMCGPCCPRFTLFWIWTNGLWHPWGLCL